MSEQQMYTSILGDAKLSLGLNPDEPDEFFDPLIIGEANAAIARLTQIGLGKLGDFIVEDSTDTWADYLAMDSGYLLPFAKSYVQKRVKLNVDPPQSGSLSSSLEQEIDKLEFNIQTAIELHNIESEEGAV